MRVVFMGTPEFGAVSLRKLISSGYDVAAVFTQPDRQAGRGNKTVASPVKQAAIEHGIPVYQPEKISRECAEILRSIAPDVCVTAAFGQFLSEELLAVPKYGTVNVHASLLPKHRGSAPINWSVIKGEKETGVTTMFTVRKMDAGDILLSEKTAIGNDETAGELTERLAQIGAGLLIKTLKLIELGECPRTPQDESQMTYEPMLEKQNGLINWNDSAKSIHCLIRGVSPWPGAYTSIGNETVKIWSASVAEQSGKPGELLYADARNGLVISCGKGSLEIGEIQVPGGKRMKAKDYLRGHSFSAQYAGGDAND